MVETHTHPTGCGVCVSPPLYSFGIVLKHRLKHHLSAVAVKLVGGLFHLFHFFCFTRQCVFQLGVLKHTNVSKFHSRFERLLAGLCQLVSATGGGDVFRALKGVEGASDAHLIGSTVAHVPAQLCGQFALRGAFVSRLRQQREEPILIGVRGLHRILLRPLGQVGGDHGRDQPALTIFKPLMGDGAELKS